MKRGGYFQGGLRKVEAATKIGEAFDENACTSPSFMAFRNAVIEAAVDRE